MPDPLTLLDQIVAAYDTLVRAELAGKHDVIEVTRDALRDLVEQARRMVGAPAGHRR